MQITADKFYERLDYWLAEMDISTYRLCKMCEISSSTLYNGKNGNRHLTINNVGKIIDALGLTTSQFFGEDDTQGFEGALLEIKRLSEDFSPEQMQALVTYAKFVKNDNKDQ